jgi:nicotinamide-nucleotide amidase
VNAEIVVTGSELLLGDSIDTNSALMARMLRDIGLDLYYKTTVGDNRRRMAAVLSLALQRSDIVLTSGGLGPTVDDVTREAVADATGRPLTYYPELWSQIANRFAQYGRSVSENNRRQAYAPQGAMLIENEVGTAPAFIVETENGTVISLPGVPRELEYLMTHRVIPYLQQRVGSQAVIVAKVLRTCAVGESRIDSLITDLMTGSNPTVGLLAHSGQVDVRITAKAGSRDQAAALIAPVEADVRRRLGAAVYGEGTQTLDEVLDALLAESGHTVAVLDTVTAGQLERMLPLTQAHGHLVSYAFYPSPESACEALGETSFCEDISREEAARRAAGLAREGTEASLGLVIWGEKYASDTASDGPHAWSFVVVHDGEVAAVKEYHFGGQNELTQRWMSIRALDLVRRLLMGALEPERGGIDD